MVFHVKGAALDIKAKLALSKIVSQAWTIFNKQFRLTRTMKTVISLTAVAFLASVVVVNGQDGVKNKVILS